MSTIDRSSNFGTGDHLSDDDQVLMHSLLPKPKVKDSGDTDLNLHAQETIIGSQNLEELDLNEDEKQELDSAYEMARGILIAAHSRCSSCKVDNCSMFIEQLRGMVQHLLRGNTPVSERAKLLFELTQKFS